MLTHVSPSEDQNPALIAQSNPQAGFAGSNTGGYRVNEVQGETPCLLQVLEGSVGLGLQSAGLPVHVLQSSVLGLQL